MIVKEYQTGSGRVCFHDDFIKPKEEQERIMNALTEKVQGWLVNKIIASGNAGEKGLLNSDSNKEKTA